MLKSELIEYIASKLDLTVIQSAEVTEIFFDSITQSLLTEGRVEIRGFGTFTVRKYKEYSGRNPKTGATVQIPGKQAPFWKAGLELERPTGFV